MDDASCTYPDRGNDAEEVLWSKDVQDSAILMKQHLAGVKIDYTGLAAASSWKTSNNNEMLRSHSGKSWALAHDIILAIVAMSYFGPATSAIKCCTNTIIVHCVEISSNNTEALTVADVWLLSPMKYTRWHTLVAWVWHHTFFSEY